MLKEKVADKIEDIYLIEKKCKTYFKIKNNSFETPTLFFRGQADFEWILEPSIKRTNTQPEYEIFRDYKPDSDIKDLFTYIAKYQHYNEKIKTRFLDFSTDINVALFFACYDYNDKDGALYICPYTPRTKEWCDTYIVSELTILNTQKTIGDFANDLYNKYTQIKDKFKDTNELATNIVSWIDHGFMVLPDSKEYEMLKKNNRRIIAQKGAFFICGNKTEKPLTSARRTSSYAPNNIILPLIADVPSTISDNEHAIKIRIPSTLKKDIIKYLNDRGIKEKNLLCD